VQSQSLVIDNVLTKNDLLVVMLDLRSLQGQDSWLIVECSILVNEKNAASGQHSVE